MEPGRGFVNVYICAALALYIYKLHYVHQRFSSGGLRHKNGSQIFSDMVVKEIVHPKFAENLLSLRLFKMMSFYLLTNGSSAVNGCRQNESPNIMVKL